MRSRAWVWLTLIWDVPLSCTAPRQFLPKSLTHLQTRAELHHLLGLDVLEAVDAGDTVTDAQHAASLLQVGLRGRPEDALLEDGRDLGGGGRGRRRRRQLLGQDSGRGAILGHLKSMVHSRLRPWILDITILE